jgi:hypothetical protein
MYMVVVLESFYDSHVVTAIIVTVVSQVKLCYWQNANNKKWFFTYICSFSTENIYVFVFNIESIFCFVSVLMFCQ